ARAGGLRAAGGAGAVRPSHQGSLMRPARRVAVSRTARRAIPGKMLSKQIATPSWACGVRRTAGARPGSSPVSANGTSRTLSYRPTSRPEGANANAELVRPPSRLVAITETLSSRAHDRIAANTGGL